MTKSRIAMLFAVALGCLALPTAAHAQSAIAGVVKDTTGAVLPGVTVEATSPALIEKTRSVATNDAGLYRIIDLRPGSYTVTFTLVGFSTVKREGIELETNFTAPVNVEMRVGSLEETVTVSGQSPIVDVQTTQRREVLTREMLDALPTGRNYQTVGAVLPSVSMGRFDVGGSTAMQQGGLMVYGSLSNDTSLEVDGMKVDGMIGSGACGCIYHNEGQYEEFVFQVSGGAAESQTGGVRLNMIPKQGGNQFKGQVVALFANTDLQSLNATDQLRARGLTLPAKLYQLYDYNASLGGPIKRDKLWFFISARRWAFNNFVANAINPDGTQAQDDNVLEAYPLRLTYQVNQKNKITAVYDKDPKYRGHRELEFGGVDPKASVVQTVPLGYIAQAKWTSTVTDKLLVEAGYSSIYYGFTLRYQPEVKRPSATDPYGDISKVDLITGTRRNAALQDFFNPFVAYNVVASVSYVTGSHALKTGIQQRWGWFRAFRTVNGDLIQRYRSGVPDSVEVKNTPINSESDINADLGLYVQDSWTMRRLTLNPGLRFEYFNGGIPEQNAPAGRFVPARHFDAIPNLPNWKNLAPRVGAAYDLFGDGKTAIKASIGKYMQQEAVGYPELYNPMVLLGDVRTWTDLNGDDIAQNNEIGPPTSGTFGVRRNRNPDPSVQRPYQILSNVGIQHQLRPGLGLSASYNRRSFYHLAWTDNLATTFADYTLITVPDPRGNGQTLPVYNLNLDKRGLINEQDNHSDQNGKTYNGIDLTVNARLPNGATIFGGTSTGRIREVTCQVDDPNWTSTSVPGLRNCDQTKLDVPFITAFKLSGSYPLPWGLRLSGVFQSVLGEPRVITYLVNRAIVPTLTQAQVTVRLNEPGSEYYDRNNQLDFGVAKTFQIGRVKLKPQLDLFNALNVSPVVSQIDTFGSSLGRPLRILDPRLLRIGVQLEF